MMPAAEVMPLKPNGREVGEVVGVPALQADARRTAASTPSLISTMTALTFADSLAPRISSSVHSTIRIDRRHVEDAALLGRLRQRPRGS